MATNISNMRYFSFTKISHHTKLFRGIEEMRVKSEMKNFPFFPTTVIPPDALALVRRGFSVKIDGKVLFFLFEHLRELFVRRRVEHQLVQREEKTWKVAMKKFIFLLMENILFSLAILSLLAFTCVLKLFKQQIINHFIFLCATHCLPQPHHINSRRRNIVKVD